MKRIFIALIILFLVVPTARVSAALLINEIMYDPAGSDTHHEWVELYNNGSDPVNIVGGSGSGSWRFYDGGNHYISSSTVQGSLTINPNSYAVLADDPTTFLSDFPSFVGTLIDTTINLPNSTGTVKVTDGGGNILDSVDYLKDQGGYDDGNSLQRKVDGTWIAATPTPGAANFENSTSASVGTSTNSSGTFLKLEPLEQVTLNPDISISLPRFALAGIEVQIRPHVLNMSDSSSYAKAFHFGLGDGSEYNTNVANPFTHIYKHPGIYVINFTYKSSQYEKSPSLSARATIEVLNPAITITGVEKDGTIEIKNNSSEEEDISLWKINSLVDPTQSFVIPEGTSILPGKTIYLESGVTGFSEASLAKLYLLLPSGGVTAVYDNSPQTDEVLANGINTPPVQVIPSENYQKSQTVIYETSNTATETLREENPKEGQSIENTQQGFNSLYMPIFSLIGVIIIFIFLFWKLNLMNFYAKNQVNESSQQNYKEDVSVDDIKIVE